MDRKECSIVDHFIRCEAVQRYNEAILRPGYENYGVTNISIHRWVKKHMRREWISCHSSIWAYVSINIVEERGMWVVGGDPRQRGLVLDYGLGR